MLDVVGLTDVAGKTDPPALRRHAAGGWSSRRRCSATRGCWSSTSPPSGSIPEQRLRFRDTISALAEDRCVVVSTHQTEDVSAFCPRIVVLHEGRVRFDGSPRELADTAVGRVWVGAARDPGARLAWRIGDGGIRQVGTPPPGARLVEPSLEDGYLLLVGEAEDRSGGGGMTTIDAGPGRTGRHAQRAAARCRRGPADAATSGVPDRDDLSCGLPRRGHHRRGGWDGGERRCTSSSSSASS